MINNNDSLIFDLASATLTATYIDIPVYALSDDVILSVDYSIQFNLTKLTYSTTVDLLPNDPTILSAAFFNPVTTKLKYTGSTLQNYPAGPSIVHITKIRFTLTTPCTLISAADFNNVVVYLNGIPCGTRFTTLDFTQFIPTANFTTGPTCTNANLQYSNTSSVTTGIVNNWAWNFGNGNSTQTNPSNSYTAAGTAATTLIVTTAIGCKDTVIKTFTVSLPPTSSFSYSYNCIKDSVFFTNTSTVSAGSVSGAQWHFGDQSGTSNDIHPVYHYATSGFFTASLVAISDVSCTATSTLVLNLTNKVVANFTTTSINKCQGSTITFSDASTYSLSTINGWTWDFGDGNISSGQSTTHTFTTAGVFTVTLISTAGDGCNGKTTRLLNIDPLPVVQFAATSTTGCANVPLNFSDQSTTPPNSAWLWMFGDSNTSTLQNPSHSYTASGQYSVKLVVLTPAGCSDSLTKSTWLTIHDSPNTTFSLSENCVNVDISFVNTTSIATGSIVSWQWSFGDNGSSTVQSPIYSYSNTGTYLISLTATSDLGCAITFTRTALLSNKPIVSFNQISGLDCSGETLSFTNLSVPLNGPSFTWRFGDGSSSTQQSPVHTYMNSGFYAIKLVAINPGGCGDSLTKPYTVTVPPPVAAHFTYAAVSNSVLLFTNTSENSVKSKWDFGDNTGSLANNPQHTFPEITNYRVCLTAYNSLNCADSICDDVFTGISRIIAIPSAFTPNDDSNNDVLRVRGGPFQEMEFTIYNEWGNVIFSATEQQEGWDGTYRGEAQPVGVYEYVLRAKTFDDKKVNLYGVVNLTR